MEPYQWAVLMGGIFLFLVIYSIYSQKKQKKETMLRLDREWAGKGKKRRLTDEEIKLAAHFFEEYSLDENVVDDITWNDLDMDRLFLELNNTNSSIGRECFYRMLRVIEKDKDVLNDRDKKAEYFAQHKNERLSLQYFFARIGFCRNMSYFDYIWLLAQVKPGSNLSHYLLLCFNVAAVITLIFINSQIGILMFIAGIALSIVLYYRELSKIKPYFSCIKIIVRALDNAKELIKMNIPVLEKDCRVLSEYIKELDFIGRGAGFISFSGSMDGSLGAIILDYVKMLTHIDIIMFNKIIRRATPLSESIVGFSKIMGDIECCLSIASFRQYFDDSGKVWCRPQLTECNEISLTAKDMTHPMIENAIANSITADKGVLITGSNASGKSTFIKTVAINAIMSQTIYTACAGEYAISFCRVYSSMALTDNLLGNESYFMVEIRSLKRILDACGKDGLPVLCMVDEVLRGTNTIERIAASSQILKSLAKPNVLMFAATHDIELTTVLKHEYDNYHFQEEVSENDITFNYKLYKGPAVTRNAIRLLRIMGYDESIVLKADEMASSLIKKN